MKNLSKQKLIEKVCKLLKTNEKKIFQIKRKNYDSWDSLLHLQLIFIIEKNLKKKISINKINKINTGREIISFINENYR